MSERHSVLQCLKTQGEVTAADMADHTGLTSMGARGHLERLHAIGLVAYREEVAGRGRPKRLWYLTELGHQQFPQRYDHLSIELLDNVRQTFGEEGLEKLISLRETQALQKYQHAIAPQKSAEAAIVTLAEQRTAEGYMAEVIATDGGWELIEHHCPICAAAETCQNFCRSELTVFQQALGDNFSVQRTEHLMSNGSRCRYTITTRDKGEQS